MTSILTNNSAMVALQTLKGINAQLGKTQADIATGKSVANAKDNAAIWAISKVMETDQVGFKTIQSNLNVADAVVSTARAGGEKIIEDLKAIRDLATAASNTALSSERAKISNDIELRFKQIASVINGTQMNGVNLLKSDEASLNVLASLDRSSGPVTSANMISVSTASLDTLLGLDLTTGESTLFDAETSLSPAATDDPEAPVDPEAPEEPEDPEAPEEPGEGEEPGDPEAPEAATDVLAFISSIERAINSVLETTADLGSVGKRITDQSSFVGKLSDSLKAGIGALVDADMEEASARLQALQTQQQLGIQSLSIANQAPGAVMALFR